MKNQRRDTRPLESGREPLFKKQVRLLARLFSPRSREASLKEAFVHGDRIARSLPAEIAELVNQHRHDRPLLMRQVQEYCERKHLMLDEVMLKQIESVLKAAKDTVKASTDLKRELHEAGHIDAHLEQDEEYRELHHEMRMAEGRLKLENTDPELAAARRAAELETLKAQSAKQRATQRHYERQIRPKRSSPAGRPEFDKDSLSEEERERQRSARDYHDHVDSDD